MDVRKRGAFGCAKTATVRKRKKGGREREKERDEGGSGKKDREKRGWTPRCQVAR